MLQSNLTLNAISLWRLIRISLTKPSLAYCLSEFCYSCLLNPLLQKEGYFSFIGNTFYFWSWYQISFSSFQPPCLSWFNLTKKIFLQNLFSWFACYYSIPSNSFQINSKNVFNAGIFISFYSLKVNNVNSEKVLNFSQECV